MVSIIAAVDLVMQGARASATMLLTQLNWDNSIPAPQGLTCHDLTTQEFESVFQWTDYHNKTHLYQCHGCHLVCNYIYKADIPPRESSDTVQMQG